MTVPQSIKITKTTDKDHLYHHISLPSHTLTIASRREDTDDSDNDIVDPHFFDPSYTLAAATGFSVWEGAVSLLRCLLVGGGPEVDEMRQRILVNREGVVEVGCGTGVGGLGVASLGGDVLCTDVESVVGLCKENVVRNRNGSDEREGDTKSMWKNPVMVGKGTATVQTLDWSLLLSSQTLPNNPRKGRIVIAAETAWLKELAPLFVDTVVELLRPDSEKDEGANRVCYWAYKERGTEESKMFTTMGAVKGRFEELGCEVGEIWREESGEDVGKWVVVNVVRWRGNVK